MKHLMIFVALLALGMGLGEFARGVDAPVKKPASLPEINFAGNSLSDVIDFIAEVTGINFSVNWKALETAGVTKDTRITLKIGGVTLGKVLDLVVKQASGTEPLTWQIDDGVIEITTLAKADARMITRVYGVQDLLFEAPDFEGAPEISLSNSSSSGSGRSGGGNGSGSGSGGNNLFGGGNSQSKDSNSNKTGLSQKERADEIMKMITTTIRPEIWSDNGGSARISYFRGNIIVTAPRSVHALIGG